MDNTLKWIGAISGIALGCGSGAFAYLQYSQQQSREIGRIEAENSYLRDQSTQLKQENARLLSEYKELNTAYRNKEVEISSAKSELYAVQNNECGKIWNKILGLENSLSWAGIRGYSQEQRQELRAGITEYKKTHEVCLASRK
ncbi:MULTISPECIES: hypothetical protein [Pseudomonas]|uniref:Lipoprotein n=2 Tax=Pseudomonas syringae group TaxID=136849 RepID=A0A0P9NEW8_PSESX|nr:MULTISPECIES: hypothetical protein [Pseudomonas]KPW97077.1 Unknown protein sequence [Pseudomonas syringae pv. castaneae]KWS91884.1 hypothetical protein AL048_28245 [Pseudomonas syringae pv. castaneae]MBP1086034.1 cell division protein FtsB [Pseudomonas sp. PvP007]MBP1192930.1 cell division protein FtsB [Pseudomonas sp. PvP100]RMS94293.1 hypothetical protein ALP58_00815 [Pseudomonas savastanoi]